MPVHSLIFLNQLFSPGSTTTLKFFFENQLKPSTFATSQDVTKIRDFPALISVEELPLCVRPFQDLSVGDSFDLGHSEHSSGDPNLKKASRRFIALTLRVHPSTPYKKLAKHSI